MHKAMTISLAFLVILFSSCNMPMTTDTIPSTENPAAVYTKAAQTIEAELTRLATSQTSSESSTPIVSTEIPLSTVTPVSSATSVPIPCNRATYNPATIDVTIPDGMVILPGQVFTKTWRITNSGTCTWTPAYQLVFHQGDALGVPAGYAQSLTSGSVIPGASVDISVNLTAPMASGEYKGYWRLREPGGQFFGLNNSNSSFYVAITVSGDTVLNVNPIAGESGSVSASGSVTPNVFNIGDTITDDGTQAFLSFDISSIPAGSTIKNVKLDLTNGYTIQGAPFTTLGCLYFYANSHGTLDAGDFVLAPPPGGLIKLCNSGNLGQVISDDDDWIAGVQSRVGTTRFQVRIQFSTIVTDMNATADMVKLGIIALSITYQRP